MYRSLRTLHLCLGLLALPALLVYGLSAIQFTLALKPDPPARARQVPLRADPHDLVSSVDELATRHGVKGAIVFGRADQSGAQLELYRGSTVHRVHLTPDGVAEVETRRGGPVGLFTGMHVVAGLEHADPPSRAWAVVSLVSGLSLLLLTLTGLVLWLQRPRERRLGLAFVLLNLAWGGGTLIWIRLLG